MSPDQQPHHNGSVIEVFLTFLKLGLTSFGGPIAHLGYFRKALVEQRSWVSEQQYAQLLAICQFLPGPASSQLGFSLGMQRAGWLGALAAFIAFTLPSVLLLITFASALPMLAGSVGQAVIHGLELVACAVVADAVVGMSRKLCPDNRRRAIAILSAAIVVAVSSAASQLFVVAAAAFAGAVLLRDLAATGDADNINTAYGTKTGGVFLLLFFSVLLGLPLVAGDSLNIASVAEAFYRAGALVFGGGHVVLPLLEDSVVATGWVSAEQFLAGYGASQAIPGPMFSFSAYLGAVMVPDGSSGVLAAVAVVFMFLPGFLLIAGVLPFWQAVSHSPLASRAIAGVNAAVVGLLAAALYNPIFTSGIGSVTDWVIALIGFGLLIIGKRSPLWVVLWCVLANVALTLLGF